MPTDFARMTAPELEALPRTQTVFFFPVGPLEDHGPHLPMNLDLAEAEELCQQAAARLERELPGWRGVVMPAAPLGIEANTGAIRIVVRPHVLRDWLVDACKSLARSGFKQFVCFSGHAGPKQLTAIEEAGKLVGKRLPFRPRGPVLVSACSARVGFRDVSQAPLWLDPGEHGGTRDTSVALHLAKRQGIEVARDYAKLPPEARRSSGLMRWIDHLRRKRAGYWGSPALADPLLGEKLLLGSLDEIFPKLRAVWEGSNPQSLFRSWYSVMPMHKSFFRAYVIAFAFLGLICLWILFNLQGL
jgi:creatinine amidohydrolase/Fe(II)-dependent formamide hydrolase-like protein